ncbi:efflux RND transporter permease subunit, partial [Rhizobium ruizarguesonis]
HDPETKRTNVASRMGSRLADGFTHGFDRLSSGYSWTVRHLVISWVGLTAAMVTFFCLLGATWYMGTKVPAGFIPTRDQGYASIGIQLPDGASLARTDAVGKQVG